MKKQKFLATGALAIFAGLLSTQTTKAIDYIDVEDFDNYDAVYAQEIEPRDYKILMIEFNPTITSGSVNGHDCAGLTAVACFNAVNGDSVSFENSIRHITEDITYASHGLVVPRVVETITIDEYPRYTGDVGWREGYDDPRGKDYPMRPMSGDNRQILTSVSTGQPINQLDDATFLDIMKARADGKTPDQNSNWYILDGTGFLDYNYYIEHYNLSEKKNNDEFDAVWVSGFLLAGFESTMAGRSAYPLNGVAYPNNESAGYMLLSVSLTRPDTIMHCFGHTAEGIMNYVTYGQPLSGEFFESIFTYYEGQGWKKTVNASNYDNLSLWEKFTLYENVNTAKGTGLSGVGIVHFAPNSTSDYDYSNTTTQVVSRWREWEHYPNFDEAPDPEPFNPNVYLSDNSYYGSVNPDRSHIRWWFSLFPHVYGHTENGELNNWWENIYRMGKVKVIEATEFSHTYTVGDRIDDIAFEAIYDTGNTAIETIKSIDRNISFDNADIIGLDQNGKIYARAAGTTTVSFRLDERAAYAEIVINEAPATSSDNDDDDDDDGDDDDLTVPNTASDDENDLDVPNTSVGETKENPNTSAASTLIIGIVILGLSSVCLATKKFLLKR